MTEALFKELLIQVLEDVIKPYIKETVRDEVGRRLLVIKTDTNLLVDEGL